MKWAVLTLLRQETNMVLNGGGGAPSPNSDKKWGEKMFKLVHKNKKGVTLTELMVCVVVLALIVPLAGQILFNFLGVNDSITDKWHVQTAVRMVCNEFNASKDSLTNAFQVDLLYDPVVDAGATLNDDGTITWKGGVASPSVMYAEGSIIDTDPYTYIFSTPTWDSAGNYLGELLYKRDHLAPNSELLLVELGFADVPVEISFTMATTEEISADNVKYSDASIHVKFTSGREDMYPYELETSFAIVNNSRPINKKTLSSNQETLVYEQKWLDPSGNPNAYPAGWSDYGLNTDDAGNFVSSSNNFPSSSTTGGDNATSYYLARYIDNEEAVKDANISETYDAVWNEDKNGNGKLDTNEDVNGNGKLDTAIEYTAPVITKEANVLRYVSPTAQKTQGDVAERKTGANIATCLTGWAMMGSSFEDVVLQNLRAFRDNVLAGTDFGDWFIHQYYYVWSPFVVDKLEVLKPVVKAVLIPISYVCGFVAQE